jgi:hypothetical protein
MKNLLWFSLLILSACGSDINQNVHNTGLSSDVTLAINAAKKNKDHRLMYTLGRNPVIPGFETEDFTNLKKLCGVKAQSGTGDVLKSASDKQKRRIKYQFSKQYNIKMYDLCQNHRMNKI